MSPLQQIAQLIKHTREAKGWSQEDLATKLGWSKQAISRIENGRHNLSMDKLEDIARALGLREITIKIPRTK